MQSHDLSPECRELLVYASSVAIGEQWIKLEDVSRSLVQELVSKGLLEYRSGSRQGNHKPRSIVVTAEGRRLAKQIRNQADGDDKSN